MARVLSEQDQQEYFSNDVERQAKIELVRNPFIALYLHKIQHQGKTDYKKLSFDINVDELIPVNQDTLYNDKVSLANRFYSYTNKIREASNIRYVKSSSEIIPEDYKNSLIDFGADEEEFLVPFDYILVTRCDGTQFMIAEDFSNTSIPREIHRYNIIRYAGETMPFKVDSIYSDGIDLSRILTNDNKYIDVFANLFLSEYRLNESLLSAYGAMDEQKSDETDHGGGYVGYIDSKSLQVSGSMERNELLLFERIINGRRIAV